MWRGLPVVRSWPRKYQGPPTPNQIPVQTAFGDYLTRATATAPTLIAAEQQFTARTAWTWRDAQVAAVYGTLYR